jgi:hypothetical protein
MDYSLIIGNTVSLFPYSVRAFREDHPRVSLPENPSKKQLEEVGLFETIYESRPEINYTKNAVLGDLPVLKNGQWTVEWTVEDASILEIEERTQQQKDKARQQRNQALTSSDWTQLSDAPVNSVAWSVYRQELRDVTAQAGFPWEVVWPEAP